VRLAVAEQLVTPHTSAVGVRLRRNAADPAAAANVVEVPLQVRPREDALTARQPASMNPRGRLYRTPLSMAGCAHGMWPYLQPLALLPAHSCPRVEPCAARATRCRR
jgi:hypothetical protein